MKLVDANLLIYAFDQASEHHSRAQAWLEDTYAEDDLVGLPQVVLLAFVRIITNPRVMARPATSREALERLDLLLSHPKTVVVDCGPSHWALFREVTLGAGVYGPSITDAHLATLALEHGATLCSHDEGFRRFPDLRFEDPLR